MCAVLQVGHCAIGMFRTLIVTKCNHIYFGAVISAAGFFCFTGIVRTSVIVTGVQVLSRIFMVWFIASSIRQVTVPLDSFFNFPLNTCFLPL